MQHVSILRRFTIRSRMLGTIAVVLALLLLVGGTGLWGLHRVAGLGDRFVATTHADTVRLSRLREGLGNARRFEKDLLINLDKRDQVQGYLPKWQAAVDEARRAVQALNDGQNDEGAALAREIAQLLDAYAAAAPAVFRQIEGGTFENVGAPNKALGPAKVAAHKAEELIGKLEQHLAGEAAAIEAERAAAARRADLAFGIAIAVAIALFVPLTLLNMRSICGPIDEARRAAETIAGGDLSSAIDVTGRDEPGAMLSALARMRGSLQSLIGQVRLATDSVGTAAMQIAEGNADLSQRTEQAASSLQQTASSMEQFTGTVTQTAQSARTASQLASSASSVAQRGGAVVSQVVSTMDEISASSRRISEIIGTIDGIAFQTNILALNAAVEAARAGEQGRGFAVVAAEVRSLAQRSASAAREIKGLIGSSVEKVESGSRLVADAGSTMTELVASVQRVNDIIAEISAAAAEQSSGIGQVNQAVTQLDRATQQNAALVEESAAAAESLQEQSRHLTTLVAAFHVGHDVASAAMPHPPATPGTGAPAQRTVAGPRAAARTAITLAKRPSFAGKTDPTAPAAPVVAIATGGARGPGSEPGALTVAPVAAAASEDADWETF